ncbi:hypothetical protein O3G_MSEX004556 [Manduca sexta]|uniref:Uncharacterized protein n=1 Tax=Manduca sexta TaxID=7130 RepID=A0A922CH57_MANSE|nr:hypothetical protein O3G_MSEX004556 [Manduca sexta]
MIFIYYLTTHKRNLLEEPLDYSSKTLPDADQLQYINRHGSGAPSDKAQTRHPLRMGASQTTRCGGDEGQRSTFSWPVSPRRDPFGIWPSTDDLHDPRGYVWAKFIALGYYVIIDWNNNEFKMITMSLKSNAALF